jgi:hypothetical protein
MRNGLTCIFSSVVCLAACSDDVEPDAQQDNAGGTDGEGLSGEGGEGGGEGEGGDEDSMAMPDNAYCQPATDWNPVWIAHAEEVVALVNAARMTGGTCGAQSFAPAPMLTWSAALMCASRVHSGDMADHDYVDHTNLDGKDAGWRFQQAGFSGKSWAESLGAGYATPAEVVQGWLDSEINCPQVRDGKFTAIGVGYAFEEQTKYQNYWTLSLGGP